MTCRTRTAQLLVAVTLAMGLFGCASSEGDRHQSTLARTVDGQVITSTVVPAATIEVAAPFKYVGGNRFVLRGHTDVEQHFFVIAGDRGQVERMYWLQFEAKLPSTEGSYDYPSDDSVEIGPLSFVTHVRHYDSEPAVDSDRGAAYRFLSNLGYEVPTPAVRARLVHIPESERRRELMIVYLERVESAGEIAPEAERALLNRARSNLTIRRDF